MCPIITAHGAVIITVDFNLFDSCNFVLKTYAITVCIIINYLYFSQPCHITSWANSQVRNDDPWHMTCLSDSWLLFLCICYITPPSFSPSLSPPFCKGKSYPVTRLPGQQIIDKTQNLFFQIMTKLSSKYSFHFVLPTDLSLSFFLTHRHTFIYSTRRRWRMWPVTLSAD